MRKESDGPGKAPLRWEGETESFFQNSNSVCAPPSPRLAVHAALFGFSFRHHLSIHAFMGNLEKMNETQIFSLLFFLL
jgi:hypothetical protein